MTFKSPKPLLAGAAVAALLAFVAACSGTSPSMNPTAPTAAANSAAAGANFSPNPHCDIDPTAPSCEPPDLASGRFTGGGNIVVDPYGKITYGFTIHCDILLTNNLEINWGGGNNFHIDKESLTAVSCTKPTTPNPPKADVSQIVATSPGTCNGLPATITFFLEDSGEPGVADRVGFNISGGCSLNVGPVLTDGGNVQAHFDQPHK